ncbi:MAG: hypothetical protein V1827_05280 [Candidatus Micrarchaeota archaeon]
MTDSIRKIVPLGCKAGYLEAQEMAKARGMKLASHVLHDDILVRTDGWKRLEGLHPAWMRELVVHPEKNGVFVNGKDVVDSQTGWRLPAKYLTDPRFVDADVFRKGVGLFVDPDDVREERGKVIVIPASIVVLHPFIQQNGDCGKVDENTRVPLALEPQSEEEKRWLFRVDGAGVRPLARNRVNLWDGYCRRNVDGNCRPDDGFGVAVETDSESDAAMIPGMPASVQSPDERMLRVPVESLLVSPRTDVVTGYGTPENVLALVEAARAEFQELSGAFPLEKLRALNALLQALHVPDERRLY